MQRSGSARQRSTDAGRPVEESLAILRDLAGEKGYRMEKALIGACWYLVNEATGELALSDLGTSVFTVERAIRFLSALS